MCNILDLGFFDDCFNHLAFLLLLFDRRCIQMVHEYKRVIKGLGQGVSVRH